MVRIEMLTLRVLTVSVLVMTSACAGRNIHPRMTADSRVLVREWTYQTRQEFAAGEKNAEFSNPVIYENTLVFGSQSKGLVALYPSTNQVRWSLEINHGVTSELAVDKGSVYFVGGDGQLYSVNLENGRINWQYAIRNPVVSQPTIKGGRLFVTASDDTVYAFDAGSGQWLWHYRRNTAAIATMHGASSPLVDEEDVLVGLSDGFLVCLSLNDGKLKWEKKIHDGRKFTDVDAHPVLDGATIYVPSYDGGLYALQRKSGDILWKFDAGGGKRISFEGSKLFLPSSDGNLYALDKSSGKLLWKFELDSGTPTQLILTERYAIFGSTYQYLYAVDKMTGEGTYRFNVGRGSGFYGSPALDAENRRLYIISGAGNLMTFSITKPRKVFKHGSTDPYTFWDPI